METQHWVMLIIVGVVMYIVGAKYPAYAARLGF